MVGFHPAAPRRVRVRRTAGPDGVQREEDSDQNRERDRPQGGGGWRVGGPIRALDADCNNYFQIVIQRRLLSLILTTFIPTIILNVIGHMSNYFKEFFFEGLMGLNVTVMLVLTTMFLR